MAIPAYLQQMVDWMNNKSTFIFGRWEGFPEGGYEGGLDIGSAGGTPVYALETGPLLGSAYFCHGGSQVNAGPGCSSGSPGYGVVTQRINVPGYGVNDIYYQHIDIDPSLPICGNSRCNGVIVQKGQRIGTIRSNVRMLEIGFNAGNGSPAGHAGGSWGGPWGGTHPQPWVTDPRPMVAALISNFGNASLGAPGMIGDPTGTGTGSTSGSLPLGLDALIPAMKASFVNLAEEVAVFMIALLVIAIGIMVLFGRQIEGVTTSAAKKGAEIAMVA